MGLAQLSGGSVQRVGGGTLYQRKHSVAGSAVDTIVAAGTNGSGLFVHRATIYPFSGSCGVFAASAVPAAGNVEDVVARAVLVGFSHNVHLENTVFIPPGLALFVMQTANGSKLWLEWELVT